MSLRAFAKRLGVTRQAVELAIGDGRLTMVAKWGRGWTITDADRAEAEWKANTRPRRRNNGLSGPQEPDSRPSPTTLAAATLREREARAKMIELDYERKKRTLIPLREAEMAHSARIVAARTKMLGVPSRAKQRLPHLTVADLAVLEALIREALEELAGEGESA